MSTSWKPSSRTLRRASDGADQKPKRKPDRNPIDKPQSHLKGSRQRITHGRSQEATLLSGDGRDISAADCGENRLSRHACPESCEHNPFNIGDQCFPRRPNSRALSVSLPPGSVAIALEVVRERKRRQPGLALYDPALVGWHQLVGSVQGSQVHFDFVRGTREYRRSASGAEEPPGEIARLAGDLHRVLREDRGCVKESSVELAAVQAVTKAYPIG